MSVVIGHVGEGDGTAVVDGLCGNLGGVVAEVEGDAVVQRDPYCSDRDNTVGGTADHRIRDSDIPSVAVLGGIACDAVVVELVTDLSVVIGGV